MLVMISGFKEIQSTGIKADKKPPSLSKASFSRLNQKILTAAKP